jgi:acyl-coenzyme A thioesterase PaaI-like protein
MLTANLRVDYLEPVADERFRIESRVVHSRGRTHLVEVAMKSLDDRLLTLSLVTLRERERDAS